MMFNHAWDQDMKKLYFGRNRVSQKLQDGLLREIAKAIIPHHLADWDVRQILKDYDRLKEDFPGVCATEKTIENLCKGTSIDCTFNDNCLRPVFIIPDKGNELGYLLGICDMLSQAGRENTELPTNTASTLGIKYRDIHVCVNSGSKDSLDSQSYQTMSPTSGVNSGSKDSLKVLLKYKKPEEMDDKLFRKYFIQPALFLGLEAKPNNSESIMVSAGGRDSVSGDISKCFFLPSLNGEAK